MKKKEKKQGSPELNKRKKKAGVDEFFCRWSHCLAQWERGKQFRRDEKTRIQKTAPLLEKEHLNVEEGVPWCMQTNHPFAIGHVDSQTTTPGFLTHGSIAVTDARTYLKLPTSPFNTHLHTLLTHAKRSNQSPILLRIHQLQLPVHHN